MDFEQQSYKSFGDVETYAVRYRSQGHWVNGFLAMPRAPSVPLPCVIYNRGGSFEYGAIDDHILEVHLTMIASWGYVVIASQYSGNAGSEGRDEIGGSELEDVLCLPTYLAQVPQADARRVGMVGLSRGGMMTYRALAQVDWIKTAATIGGITNFDRSIVERSDMFDVYERGFGNTPEGRQQRSALTFADRFCKATPLLLQHGAADWRVNPLDAIELSTKLLAAALPHRLILYEGGDHALTSHFDEAWGQIRAWFARWV